MNWNRARVRVVGGGIAGQVLRYELQVRGIPVKLDEKAIFPREKVCGGVLQPDTWAYLRDAFHLEVESVSLPTVEYFAGKKRVSGFTLEEPMVYVSRFVLDHTLDQATSRDEWAIRQDGQDDALTVSASGVGKAGGEWLGFQCEGPYAPGLRMYFGNGIYAGSAPQPGLASNHIGFLLRAELYRGPENLKQMFEDEFGIALRGPLKGTPKIHYGYTGQTLAVGDAMMTTHPFLGLGMKHAVESARLLAEMIAEGDWERYPMEHRRRFKRMANLSGWFQQVYGSRFFGPVLPWIVAHRRMFRQLYKYGHTPGFERVHEIASRRNGARNDG